LAAGYAASTAAPKDDAVVLPKPADVQSLAIHPAKIALKGGDDAQQLILTATLAGGRLVVVGLVGRPDASEMIRETVTGAPGEAAALGAALAQRLLARGADRILRELEG